MQQPNNIKNKNRQYTNANENQPNTTRNKTQEEVTTDNTSNITIRKKTNNKPQNTKTNQQYKTVNEPSPVTDKEFPKLTENNNTKRKEHLNKSHTEKKFNFRFPNTKNTRNSIRTNARRTTRNRIPIPIISHGQI